MKGDAFREMADRCGDLPDSVMAAPGLEYLGEKSAEWEALAIRAFMWANPMHHDADTDVEWKEMLSQDAGPLRYVKHSTLVSSFAGLALFARLMAIVMREE